MALRWIEGFELFGTATGAPSQSALENGLSAKWVTTVFSSAAYLQPGRVLGKSLECQGNSGVLIRRQFASTKTTWIVGFAMKGNTANSGDIMKIFNSLELETNASGQIFVKRSSSTLGSSGDAGGETFVFFDGVWHYIELKVVIDASSGSWELRVDGSLSASGTGVNTGTPASLIEFGCQRDGQFLDDIYICDGDGSANNDFLGPVFVEGLLPTSDGNSSQWTPSTGTDHFAVIDENPSDLDGTDSLTTTTQDAKETFGYGNLTGGQSAIFGVQVNTDARKTTINNQDLRNVARSGTTENEDVAVSVTDDVNFATVASVFEQDPDSLSPWTPAGVDNAEFGFKKD